MSKVNNKDKKATSIDLFVVLFVVDFEQIKVNIYSFMPLVSFYTPLKTENLWFSDVFRMWRKGAVAWNSLNQWFYLSF